jgi:hypothetical protein
MRGSCAALVALVLGLFCGAAWAGQQDFELVNATGADIHQLFISPSNVEEWQEDVLGTGALADGDSATITFDSGESAALWDIKVVDIEGNELIWAKLNLKKISRVTLQFDDDDQPVAEVE